MKKSNTGIAISPDGPLRSARMNRMIACIAFLLAGAVFVISSCSKNTTNSAGVQVPPSSMVMYGTGTDRLTYDTAVAIIVYQGQTFTVSDSLNIFRNNALVAKAAYSDMVGIKRLDISGSNSPFQSATYLSR